MLFLVQGEVTYHPYMGRSKTSPVIRLVEANDEEEAARKFEKHYDDKSIPNDDSYSATVEDVSECIV